MQEIPTLEQTASWLVPLIKALEATNVREEREYRTVSQALILSLVETPRRLKEGITSLYLRRQDELCEKLECALGQEWLVRGDSSIRAAMWHDKAQYRDVYVSPVRMAMFYDRNGNEIMPGTEFKSGPQVRFHLVARKFSDLERRSTWLHRKGLPCSLRVK